MLSGKIFAKERFPMKKEFGRRSDGVMAYQYTIRSESLTAVLSDHGATLLKLFVPDPEGNLADVVLGFDTPDEYTASSTYFGATVGRNSNRVGGASFTLNGKTVTLDANDQGVNNLHSGFDPYKNRLWNVASHKENAITFTLHSPNGDQGFPGKADISVTYALTGRDLSITYEGVCDRDTVFNMTNHSYFNLAGHDKPEKAMSQTLSMPARYFCPDDARNIPTGQLRNVDGTPMDFRSPKPIGQDLFEDYDALNLQGGYDHNFEVFCNPCALLTDPESGRSMAVITDCPGVQFYSGNFLKGEQGKDGVSYPKHAGICLETQFYPDAVNKPHWTQPAVKAGERYRSKTTYRFL